MLYIFFQERFSLHSLGFGCSDACSTDHAGLRLIKILLSLLPECQDLKFVQPPYRTPSFFSFNFLFILSKHYRQILILRDLMIQG